jgi:hypothetical protein
MTAPRPRSRQPKQLDAGIFQTIRTYTEPVQWFAATGLSGRPGRGSWEQVTSREIQHGWHGC